MALIVCTECGKKFSDKAVSCPECGCPTEYVLNHNASEEYIEKKKQNVKRATELIIEYVEKAKQEAKEADRLFESRNRSIQNKARNSIDIFGGDATYRVVEIRADARQACDDLYSTYQSLVTDLDAFCRPLIESEPASYAIKQVCDAISFFNSESEIESNFTASFEGNSLGNVANSKYVPSIESKMIQKFWENKYKETPESMAEHEERRKKIEENRKRREEEKKREEERKKTELEAKKKEKAENDLIEARKTIFSNINEECVLRRDEFSKLLSAEMEKELKAFSREVEKRVASLQREISQFEEQLKSLGVFSFKAKGNIKQQIDILEIKVQRLSDGSVLERERLRVTEVYDSLYKQFVEELDDYLVNRFPKIKGVTESAEKYKENTNFSARGIPDIPLVDGVFHQVENSRG